MDKSKLEGREGGRGRVGQIHLARAPPKHITAGSYAIVN